MGRKKVRGNVIKYFRKTTHFEAPFATKLGLGIEETLPGRPHAI